MTHGFSRPGLRPEPNQIYFVCFVQLTVVFFASREDFFGAEAQLLWELVNASALIWPPFTKGRRRLLPRMPRQFDAGNPTDDDCNFTAGPLGELSVGLPSHPWELFDFEVEVRDRNENLCYLCFLMFNFVGSGRRPGWVFRGYRPSRDSEEVTTKHTKYTKLAKPKSSADFADLRR
jgi:hypothetical protein